MKHKLSDLKNDVSPTDFTEPMWQTLAGCAALWGALLALIWVL